MSGARLIERGVAEGGADPASREHLTQVRHTLAHTQIEHLSNLSLFLILIFFFLKKIFVCTLEEGMATCS